MLEALETRCRKKTQRISWNEKKNKQCIDTIEKIEDDRQQGTLVGTW